MRRALLGLVVLAGCQDHFSHGAPAADAGLDAPVPQTGWSEVALFPSVVSRELDLLFVVDDSNSMSAVQQRLRSRLNWFIDGLNDPAPDGFGVIRPSMHVGVITTDMGTQSAGGPPAARVATCDGIGRDGVLQLGTASLPDRYLIDVVNPDGSRTVNYSDATLDVMAQMLSVGTLGCGFSQPIAAIDRAFQNPVNAGFLRDSARLAIVLFSNGEDCSSASPALFSTTLYPGVGPLSTFRCTHFGVTCDVGGQTPDEMNTAGRKSECHSNEASDVMARVTEYAARMKMLKPVSRDVLFAALIGPASPVDVELTPESQSNLIVAPSCSYDYGDFSDGGFPGVRIASYAQRLPNSAVESVCSAFIDQLQVEAFRVRNLMGTSTCLMQPIATPATCEAVDIDAAGAEAVMPMCSSTNARPCIELVEDKTACPIFQGLKVEIARSPDAPAPAGTWTSVRCAL